MDPHRRNLYFKTYHKSSTRIPRQWAIYVQQYYLISTTKMTVKYASLDIARPKTSANIEKNIILNDI